MVNLDKKNDIEKYSERKSYSQPQLKEIGNINHITKGGSGSNDFDSNWSLFDPLNLSS